MLVVRANALYSAEFTRSLLENKDPPLIEQGFKQPYSLIYVDYRGLLSKTGQLMPGIDQLFLS